MHRSEEIQDTINQKNYEISENEDTLKCLKEELTILDVELAETVAGEAESSAP